MRGETRQTVALLFVVEHKEHQDLKSQMTINWCFVPESITPERHTDSTCGKQTDGIRRKMENNFRSVGFEHSPGGTSICFQDGKKQRTRNSMLFVTENNCVIGRNKRFIREKSDRISLREPGRFRMLQHVLCCSEKGRRSSSNFELENYECSH